MRGIGVSVEWEGGHRGKESGWGRRGGVLEGEGGAKPALNTTFQYFRESAVKAVEGMAFQISASRRMEEDMQEVFFLMQGAVS